MKQSLFFFIIWFGCCQLQAQPKAARVPLPIRSMDCDKAVLAGEANLRVSYALNADDLPDMGTYIAIPLFMCGGKNILILREFRFGLVKVASGMIAGRNTNIRKYSKKVMK